MLKPIKRGRLRIYTCGPTTYDSVQIGNLRTYILDDVLRRTLANEGYKLKHVMNFTDVDDKTIARSKKLYKSDLPKTALSKLTAKYEDIFIKDAHKLGISFDNTKFVHATKHIKNMQKLIRKLLKKELAYIAEDGVYFSIGKYQKNHNYGELTGTKRLNSTSKSRIAQDEYDKTSISDFALWKVKKSNEPAWKFNIGGKSMAGRPGWHIECSAMSTKYLRQPFDIHLGGVDLIFPHHENEIAQSQGAYNVPLANTFVHFEHLLVDGKKMSKSLKNYLTLTDLERKGYSPMAFRLLVLQSNYRTQLNFTWESIASAQRFLQDLYALAVLRYQIRGGKKNTKLSRLISDTTKVIRTSMANNLNSISSISALAKVVSTISKTGIPRANAREFIRFLNFIDSATGLDLAKQKDLEAQHREQLKIREKLRRDSKFKQADKIRNKLKQKGIAIEDKSYGAIWYRIL